MAVQRDDKDDPSPLVEDGVATHPATSTLNRRANSDRRTVTRGGRRTTDPKPASLDAADYLKSVEQMPNSVWR